MILATQYLPKEVFKSSSLYLLKKNSSKGNTNCNYYFIALQKILTIVLTNSFFTQLPNLLSNKSIYI